VAQSPHRVVGPAPLRFKVCPDHDTTIHDTRYHDTPGTTLAYPISAFRFVTLPAVTAVWRDGMAGCPRFRPPSHQSIWPYKPRLLPRSSSLSSYDTVSLAFDYARQMERMRRWPPRARNLFASAKRLGGALAGATMDGGLPEPPKLSQVGSCQRVTPRLEPDSPSGPRTLSVCTE
jgi:hypothetical protein